MTISVLKWEEQQQGLIPYQHIYQTSMILKNIFSLLIRPQTLHWLLCRVSNCQALVCVSLCREGIVGLMDVQLDWSVTMCPGLPLVERNVYWLMDSWQHLTMYNILQSANEVDEVLTHYHDILYSDFKVACRPLTQTFNAFPIQQIKKPKASADFCCLQFLNLPSLGKFLSDNRIDIWQFARYLLDHCTDIWTFVNC